MSSTESHAGHGRLSAWQEHCANATRDQLSNTASLGEYLDAFPSKQVQKGLSHTLLADQADVMSLIADLSAGIKGLIPSAHAMQLMATATHAKMADLLVLETVAKIKELAARGQTCVRQRIEELPSGQQISELNYMDMQEVFDRATGHLRAAGFRGQKDLFASGEPPMFWWTEENREDEHWMHIVWYDDDDDDDDDDTVALFH